MKKTAVNKITHEDYKICLGVFGGGDKMMKMNIVRSRCREIFTERINRVALSCEDDKTLNKRGWD